MKKVRNVELIDNKKLPIIMIAIAAFMLILSVVKVEISSEGIVLGLNTLSSVISVLPLTVGVSGFMLIKTKRNAFGEFPCYIVALFIAMAFVLLFIFKLIPEGFEIFAFAICILLIYPYIITGLTVRGCMYNKFFSLGFAGLLFFVSIVALVIISILISGFVLSYLILPLMYAELILNTMCFELKPIKKNKEE